MKREEQLSLKEKFKQLFWGRGKPSEIALGLALGLFIGCLPLYGFHFFLWIAVSFLVPRANKVAMFLGTNVSLPPMMPLITWVGYNIGRAVFKAREYPPLNAEFFQNFDFKHVGSFYLPLFVGSVILGLICAVIGYGITYGAVAFKQRHKKGGRRGA